MYNQAKAVDKQSLLMENHAPLVKRIAYHMLGRLPASVQVEDLIQAGMIGLLEAARNFDATKGASFETFVGIRIRGAMLDELRKGTGRRVLCIAIPGWSVRPCAQLKRAPGKPLKIQRLLPNLRLVLTSTIPF